MLRKKQHQDGMVFIYIIAIVFLMGIMFYSLFSIGEVSKSLTASEEYTIEFDSEQEIIALKDGSSVSGSSYLGAGHLQGVNKYHYMVKEEDGALVMQEIETKKSKIYEVEDGEKTVVKKYLKIFKDEHRQKYTADTYEYHFYIPTGSVTTDFTVDLE